MLLPFFHLSKGGSIAASVMSFSSQIKAELCRQGQKDDACARAELAGILHTGGIFSFGSGKPALLLNTEHSDIVTRVFSLAKRCFSIDCELHRKQGLKKIETYCIKLCFPNFPDALDALALSLSLGIGPDEARFAALCAPAGCQEAFLRGAFLGGGSMTDPQKAYHLEFVSGSAAVAREIWQLLCGLGLGAGAMPRRENHIAYIKGIEDIITLLTLLGAHAAVLELENIRILKNIRNNVNRQINCENANIDKTVRSAMAQVENIRLIEASIGLASLPDGLQEAAELRLQNPEASLSELAALSGEGSRSRINHRLRRLSEIAQELRDKGKIPPALL